MCVRPFSEGIRTRFLLSTLLGSAHVFPTADDAYEKRAIRHTTRITNGRKVTFKYIFIVRVQNVQVENASVRPVSFVAGENDRNARERCRGRFREYAVRPLDFGRFRTLDGEKQWFVAGTRLS